MNWSQKSWLYLLYLLCAILSLTVLTSISPDRITQQALAFGLGLLLLIYLSSQDSHIFTALAPAAYLLAVTSLGLTLILGETVRGSTRWISLGSLQFQAGEFAKPLLVLAFAYFIARYPPRSLKHILINVVVYLIPTLLIFAQPDLGTALVLSAIWLTQVFMGGLSYWVMLGSAALGGLLAGYLPHLLHDYQLRRLETFVDPSSDPLGAGYNVIQSIIAVGSGGILGKGLGHGTQSHLRFLPERHTDFIFASLAEELGLLGSLLVIFCLGGLLYRLLSLATHADSLSARLVLMGSFGYLAFQTFINIGMNIGLAPVTGVTLPLISYGGSSVLATALTLGISASYARASHPTTLIEIR